MINQQWGLLGVEKWESSRRSRTLNLGAAVRCFNELSVPGLGGMWFAKPLLWACLGIQVAQDNHLKNIKTANAIEALGCWLALKQNGWQSEERLRGVEKMKGKDDIFFAKISRSSFYITQPMRQQTGELLRTLSLVDESGSRFNSFQLSPIGKEFLHVATSHLRPRKMSAVNFLGAWVRGEQNAYTNASHELLSPLIALPKAARDFLHNRINVVSSGVELNGRMRAAVAWVGELAKKQRKIMEIDWQHKPNQITDAHWQDLRSGARFFLTRDAAIELLNCLEIELVCRSQKRIDPSEILPSLNQSVVDLRKAAKLFIHEKYDPSPNGMAGEFCRECIENNQNLLLTKLVERDGRVLRLQKNKIIPGLAFNEGAGKAATEENRGETESVSVGRIIWPPGISSRLPNLFLLNMDLHGKLDSWLNIKED